VNDRWADGVVANISATVLLSILDELIRILAADGRLILTGFTERELAPFFELVPVVDVLAQDEWRCIIANFSS
jgi:ribosomal protein L11 methylase PrmA